MCSVLQRKSGNPQRTISVVRKITFKQTKDYSNAFKKHWNNTGTIGLNVSLRTWNMFLPIGLTDLHMFFMTRSTICFSSNVFVRKKLHILSNKAAILWRCTLKAFKALQVCNYAENALYYKCFSRTMPKIYITAVLTNFFRCMRNKASVVLTQQCSLTL